MHVMAWLAKAEHVTVFPPQIVFPLSHPIAYEQIAGIYLFNRGSHLCKTLTALSEIPLKGMMSGYVLSNTGTKTCMLHSFFDQLAVCMKSSSSKNEVEIPPG